MGPWNTLGKPIGTAWIGVKVANPGMAVFDGDPTCGRVSSIFVSNSTGTRFVEIGWYEDPHGTYNCLTPTGTGAKPRVLAFSYDNGTADCKKNSAELNDGAQVDFTISDANTDGVWNFSKDGSSIWTSADMTPFSSGIVINNGERQAYGYTPRAEFDGLKRMDPADGSWGNWHGTAWWASESDDFGTDFCWDSNTHTRVVLNTTSC
jgi:hypothetical protein